MNNGRIVFVGYRPKPGKEAALERLMLSHLSRLRKEGLVTDRPSIIFRAADGTVLEIFEWKSKQAIEQAHSNPEVQKLWVEYSKVCDYVPASQVKELSQLFSEFEPIN